MTSRRCFFNLCRTREGEWVTPTPSPALGPALVPPSTPPVPVPDPDPTPPPSTTVVSSLLFALRNEFRSARKLSRDRHLDGSLEREYSPRSEAEAPSAAASPWSEPGATSTPAIKGRC